MNSGAGWALKYLGGYGSGTLPPVNFNQPAPNNQQIINSAQVITVLIYLSTNLGGGTPIEDFTITFYTGAAGAGDPYTFDLDPASDALPTC